jgi:hypothetical protein
LQLVENDVQEFVINKNSSKDYILYYKTSISGNTYICKIDKDGNPLFHVETKIPSGVTVLNVFSENEDVRFHIIRKNGKQFSIDLIIDDGSSDKNNINLFTIPKSEKILNFLQMGSHTVLFTLPEDSAFLYLYKFDDQGLKPRKRIDLESKMILEGIERFGLQDMSSRFNPTPMASADSPCKMYLSENELTITVDAYDHLNTEFIHHLEKINFIDNSHIYRSKQIPYDKTIQGIASSVLRENLYFMTYTEQETTITVSKISDNKELGNFTLYPDMELYDNRKLEYVKSYPKNYISTTSLDILDKKAYKQLFIGHPRISVTELDNKNIQIVVGSFYGTARGTLIVPDLYKPISILVSAAVFAASSSIRRLSTLNGAEHYFCFNFKDEYLLSEENSKSLSVLEIANKLLSNFKNENKKGIGYLLYSNNEPYLILKKRKDVYFTIHNF